LGRPEHRGVAQEGFADFEESVKASGRPLTARAVTRGDVEALRRQAILYMPFPGIAEEARTRSFLASVSADVAVRSVPVTGSVPTGSRGSCGRGTPGTVICADVTVAAPTAISKIPKILNSRFIHPLLGRPATRKC
jgi:hypothetical protein